MSFGTPGLSAGILTPTRELAASVRFLYVSVYSDYQVVTYSNGGRPIENTAPESQSATPGPAPGAGCWRV
jgi:hypothetical protein